MAGFCLPQPALAIRLSSKLNGEMSKSHGILYRWKYVFLYHSLHKQDWIIVWSHFFATQSFCSKQTSFPVCRFLRSVRALTPLRREILETRFVALSDEPLVHYNAKKTKFKDVTISAGIFTYHSRLWKRGSFWVTMVIFKGKNVTEPTLVPPSRITWIIRLRKHRHLQQLALLNVLSVTSIKCLPTPSLSHTMNID